MDSQRNFLIIALLIVSFMIWKAWEEDKNPRLLQETILGTDATNIKNNANQITTINKQKKIKIRTDVLELTITTSGGDIEQALLLTHFKEMNSKDPFQLLETTPNFIYQAKSGITIYDGTRKTDKNPCPIYDVDQDVFALSDGQNEIIVPMTWKDDIGNTFTKTFTLKRGKYDVNIDFIIQNAGTKPLLLSSFGKLVQSTKLPSNRVTNNFSLHAFHGAAYSTQDSKYEKYKFSNIANNQHLSVNTTGGWIAMVQQYFATAWIPGNNGINNFYTANFGGGIVAICYKSQPVLIQPKEIRKLQSTLWIGPEIQDQMAIVAPHLNLIVDYGWLWFISQPLFSLLKFIHKFLGNWGFSIIVITLVVRILMYPLTKAQYTSVAKMCMLQPKIQAIRERLSNDKQRQSQELVAVYRSEKVNPFGGCFPPLIQMPIFLALYYMLIGSVELRHAPFVLWICDLSSQDPYYILPILMGITMLYIQKMSPSTVSDPMQKKIMSFIPLIFSIFFLWFPSGLVLYYIISNLITIIQQQIIYRSLKKECHTKIT